MANTHKLNKYSTSKPNADAQYDAVEGIGANRPPPGDKQGVGGSPAHEGVGVSREVGSLPKVFGIKKVGI